MKNLIEYYLYFLSFACQRNTTELFGKPLDAYAIIRIDVHVEEDATRVNDLVDHEHFRRHEHVLYILFVDLDGVRVDKVDD